MADFFKRPAALIADFRGGLARNAEKKRQARVFADAMADAQHIIEDEEAARQAQNRLATQNFELWHEAGIATQIRVGRTEEADGLWTSFFLTPPGKMAQHVFLPKCDLVVRDQDAVALMFASPTMTAQTVCVRLVNLTTQQYADLPDRIRRLQQQVSQDADMAAEQLKADLTAYMAARLEPEVSSMAAATFTSQPVRP